jgi:hypothetical protein
MVFRVAIVHLFSKTGLRRFDVGKDVMASKYSELDVDLTVL